MSPGWSNSSERMTWVKQCAMVVTEERRQQSKFGVDETAGWGKGMDSDRNRTMIGGCTKQVQPVEERGCALS